MISEALRLKPELRRRSHAVARGEVHAVLAVVQSVPHERQFYRLPALVGRFALPG